MVYLFIKKLILEIDSWYVITFELKSFHVSFHNFISLVDSAWNEWLVSQFDMNWSVVAVAQTVVSTGCPAMY